MSSLRADKRADYKGYNLVFIVGCPRSGTTWLQRLLMCHPNVQTGQESDIFDEYIGPQLRHWKRDLNPTSSGRGGVGLGCYFREEEFMALLDEYMLKLLEPMVAKLEPGVIFIEKTPSHALYIPEIIEMLPESRIIHILRDARDVVASLLAASRSWGAHWAPKTAERAAKMWVQHVEAVEEATKALSKDQFHELSYEDLILAPEDKIKEICHFLNLEWTDKDIRAAIDRNDAKKGIITTIKVAGEVARNLGSTAREPEGFVRKAKRSTWKEDLSWKEKIVTWRVARDVMKKNGYEWAFPL